MRNFKLVPGAPWAFPVLEMTLTTHSALTIPVGIFYNNVDRIHSLATLLSGLLVPTIIIERARERANHTFRASAGIDLSTFTLNEINKDLAAHKNDIERMAADNVPSSYFIELTDTAYSHIDFLAANNGNTLEAMDAWLASQVTGIWTAIEELAGDLWIASLNAHPHILAELKTKSDKKSVPLHRLAQFDFNVKNHMGDILEEGQNFSKLDGIIDAYALSFSEGGEGIIKILKSRELYALSCLRNLIVHSSSKFDVEYLSRARSIDYLPKGAKGEVLLLDADILYQVLRPALVQAVALIDAVESWLATH